MVRISIPNINITNPGAGAGACTPITKAAAVDKLVSFLAAPNRPTALLTGAGVSVDSGIRPYRGQDGRYMNPNYQSVFPLFSHYISFQPISRPILVSQHNPNTAHPISYSPLLVSANHRSYPSWFPFSVRLPCPLPLALTSHPYLILPLLVDRDTGQ